MKNLLLRSYAKINISLNVLGKKDNGYHELDMVMLPLELHDSILLSEVKNATNNYITIDDFAVAANIKYNLATSAIEILEKNHNFKNKFRITIHKNIAMQAGLGGGSSNAATTMKGVNKYLNLGISDEEMMKLVLPLGADIPFFIKCLPSRCRGIGEKITPLHVKNDYYVLIVKPYIGCSTKAVYEKLDTMDIKTYSIDDVVKALETGDDELLANSIGNSLEPAAISFVPEIEGIKNKMKELGLKIVLMSGSGSAVFALSTNKRLLKKVANKFVDFYDVEITKVLKDTYEH